MSINWLPKDNEIHSWIISTNLDLWSRRYLDILSAEELRKYGEKHTKNKSYKKYVIRKYALRTILEFYTGIPRNEICIVTGKYGKLYLEHDSRISFNTTSSGEIMICDVLLDRKIGVDIECIKPIKCIDGFIDYVFSEGEKNNYYSIDVKNKILFFYEAWTKKESFLKTEGLGLYGNLQEIDTSRYQIVRMPFIVWHKLGDKYLYSHELRYNNQQYQVSHCVSGTPSHIVFSEFCWES